MARCSRQNAGSIVCNFYVMNVASFCELKLHVAFTCSSDKSREWLALDCSEEAPKVGARTWYRLRSTGNLVYLGDDSRYCFRPVLLLGSTVVT